MATDPTDPYAGWKEVPADADPYQGWAEVPVPSGSGTTGNQPSGSASFATPGFEQAAPAPAEVPREYESYLPEKSLGLRETDLSPDEERIRSIFNDWTIPTTQDGVNQHAATMELARATNLPFTTVAQHFDEVSARRELAKVAPRRWMLENPQLAELVLNNPASGSFVSRDPGLSKTLSVINAVTGWLLPKRETIDAWLKKRDEIDAAATGPNTSPLAEAEAKLEEHLPQIPSAEDVEFKPKGPTLYKQDQKSKLVNEDPLGFLLVPVLRRQETLAGINADRTWWEIRNRRLFGQDTNVLERLAYQWEQEAQPRDYQEGEVGKLVTSAVTGTTSSLAVVPEMGKGAIVGGLVGGVAGAVGGLLLDDYDLAVRWGIGGAKAGATFGGGAGAYVGTMRLEGGGAYKEFLRAKLDDGSPVDERYAAAGSIIYENLSAAIEVGLGTVGGLPRLGPVTELIKSGSRKQAIAELLKNPYFTAATKRFMKELAKQSLEEAGEEGLQSLTKDATDYFLRSVQALGKGEGMETGKHGLAGAVDVGDAINASAEVVPSVLLQGGVHAGGAHLLSSTVNKLRLRNEVTRAKESAGIMAELANLSDSPTTKADPEAVAAALQSGGLRKNVYIEADATHAALVKLSQESNTPLDQVANEFLGEKGAERLAEAVSTGNHVEVPVAHYVKTLSGTKLAKELLPHSTISTDTPTLAQLGAKHQTEVDKVIKDEAEKLAAEYDDGKQEPAESEGEAHYLDVMEKVLQRMPKETADSARQKMNLNRAVQRTMAKRFNVSADELFKGEAMDLESGLHPQMREILSERAADEEFRTTGRANELYRDGPTNLPNRAAYEATPRAAGKIAGVLGFEGAKWLNDNGNHDITDNIMAAVGAVLHGLGLNPHRVNVGDFAIDVKDEAELNEIRAKVTPLLPEALRGLQVTGAVGPDLKSAAYVLDAHHDSLIAKGERANPRPVLRDAEGEPILDFEGNEQVQKPQRPKGLAEGTTPAALEAEAKKIQKATPELAEALRKRAEGLKPEDYFNEAYLDPDTQTWTKKAWDAMRRKQHVASLDLSGLRKANDRYGKGVGDRMLKAIKYWAQEIGGLSVDFTQFHGDEFGAQSDDSKALEMFVEHLRSHLNTVAVPFWESETGELKLIPLEFHYGYSDEASLEKADADLNERKERLKQARARGLEHRRNQHPGSLRDQRADARGDQARGASSDSAPAADTAAQEVIDAAKRGDPLPDFLVRPVDTAVAKKGDFAQARAFIGRLRKNKAEAHAWFHWCVEAKGKGHKPTVSWDMESTLARYGVVDPKDGFSGDELGRDMAARKMKGKKGGTKDGIGLVGAARDAYDQKKTVPMSRNLFKQPPDYSTVFYQFPTPEESLQRMREQSVLADALIEQGAKPVGDAESLIGVLRGLAKVYPDAEFIVGVTLDTQDRDPFHGAEKTFAKLSDAEAFIRENEGRVLYAGSPRYSSEAHRDKDHLLDAAELANRERLFHDMGFDGATNNFSDLDHENEAYEIGREDAANAEGPELLARTDVDDTAEGRAYREGYNDVIRGHPSRVAEPPASQNLPGQAAAEARPSLGNILGGAVIIPPGYTGKVVLEQNEKNLLVQHNLTAENLLHADEVGGLAAPSLAISRKEHPLEDYGDVTLLGAPTLADPATTPVFDADVYSPRYPSTGYKVASKAVRALEKELAPYSKEVGGYLANLDNEIAEDGVDVVTKRSLKPTLELAWLSERGKAPTLPKAEPEARYPGIVDAPGVLALLEAKLAKDQSIHMRDDEQAAFENEVKEAIAALPPDDDTHHMREATADWLDENGHLGIGRLDMIAREARRYLEEKAGKVDKYKAEDVLKEAVDKEGRGAFEKWAEAKIKATILGQHIVKRTDTGNLRRIPYTLENVLKEVTRKIRQGEDFNYGLGTARAAGAKKFRNLEQVKKARDKIRSEEEFRAAKGKMDERFGALVDKLRRYHADPGGFRVLDGLAEAIGESYKRGHSIFRELEASQFKNVPSHLVSEVANFAADLLAMPTTYFEAKPQRIVTLDEFSGAVVPSDAKAEVLDALRRHGVPTFTYEKGDETSRRKAIAAASDKLDILFATSDEKGRPRGYTEIDPKAEVDAQLKRLFKIVLNPNADHSTFLHESAHVFLHLMTTLAARTDAPQQLRDDYATILKWLDAKGPEDLEVKSKDENDPARLRHEKWARGFERYLMEGKSPAKRLVPMFERFRLWLSKIYRDPRLLRVELSDDIRRVFDRMVATDTEIENYQKAMGLDEPAARDIFEHPDDFEKYLDSRREVTSSVTRRMDLSIAKDRLRENERWWKDELRAERKKAAEDYEKLPERIAQQTLAGKGELSGKGTAAIRLDRSRVAAMVGEPNVKKFLISTKPGEMVDPDDVAEFLGIVTGDKPDGKRMLEGILSLKPKDDWVEARAQAQMAEKHPDVANDIGKLKDEVAKGLHGTATLEHVMLEWALLKKKLSKPGDKLWEQQQTPIEAIRLAAHNIVAGRTIGRLDVGAALRAERGAADASAINALKKNYLEAFRQKQKQLLHMFLWMEMTHAKEEREAFYELASRMSKDVDGGRTGRSSALGKANPVYREAAASMLEAIGLRSPDDNHPGATIEELVAQMKKDGQPIGIDQDVLEQIEVKPRGVKDLTVAEMRVVRDALASIKAAASGLTTVLKEGKRIDREEAIERLRDEIERNRKHVGAVASSESAETFGERLSARWTEFDGSGLRPETLIYMMGGQNQDSESWKLLMEPLTKAKHKKAAMTKTLLAPLEPKILAAMKSGSFMKRLDSDLFQGHREDLQPPKYVYQVFMMALHMGTQSSRDRLTKGRNISEQQVIDAINRHLSPAHLELVQSIWDANESLWPEARALEEKLNGIAPPKLEHTPLVTVHGTLKGGYFPAKYDSRVEDVGEKQSLDDLSSVLDPTYLPPGTSRSHLKRRAEEFSGALLLEPGLILRHMDQVVHDIAYREALLSVASIVMDPRIKKTMRERLGAGRANQFLPWLKDQGTQAGANLTDLWSRVGRAMKKRTVMSALAYRLPTAFGDLSNYLLGMRRIGVGAMLRGVVSVFKKGEGIDGRGTAFAYKHSGELNAREGQMKERFQSLLSLMTKHGGKARRILDSLDRHGFTVFEYTEKMFSVPAWLGAYHSATKEGKSHQDAVTYADAMIRRMLPAWNPTDQSFIQRARHLSPFLMFASWHNAMYNELRLEWDPVLQSLGVDPRMDTAKKAAIATAATLFIIFSGYVVGELMTGRGPEASDGDDDEKWLFWLARKMMVGAIMPLPFIGPDIGTAIESKLLHKRTNPRGGVFTSFIEPTIKAGETMMDGDKDAAEKFYAGCRALAPLTGIPTYPLVPLKYGLGLESGEQAPRGAGDVAGGFVYGQRQGQPANPGTIAQDFAEGVPPGTGP